MTIAYFQRVFYRFLGYLSWWRLVYSEAEAWNHDPVLEPGEGLDCSLHTGCGCSGPTSTLIRNPSWTNPGNPLLRRGVVWGRSRDFFFGTCFCLGWILALSVENGRIIGLSMRLRSLCFPLGISVENLVVELEGLESRSGLIMGDFACRSHELGGWRAFFRVDGLAS